MNNDFKLKWCFKLLQPIVPNKNEMKKFNLLYVDDEQSNLRIFKDTYRRRFNIFTASSAKEGIEIMENNSIDLILSDQRMPEMTGVELLKYSFQKFPKINRILITGYSDIDAVEDAINKARVFQYVQKPWDEGALLDIISDALRVYELEEENEKQKKELEIAIKKAEESDRLKTEFIYNLSHEIRTPMNGIIGFASLLDNPEVSDKDKRGFVKIIQNSSNKLLQIIDNILTISELVTNQVKVQKNEIHLNKLLSELYAVYELKAQKKNIDFILNTSFQDNNDLIITDRSKLKTIVTNLLENAFKFIKYGFIEIGYKQFDQKLVIFIKDTGVGISEENLETIFQKFSQEEKEISSKVDGLGLGLSIAQENAKLIDGKILVESQKGKGSIFRLVFPYVIPESIKQTNKEKESQRNSYIANTKLKILITEDEEINLFYLNTIINKLAKSEVEVLLAHNGKEAVEICNNNPDIDIIFMDIKMPVMDGYEASKLIKQNHPKIPIIIQTAYSTEEDRIRAFDCGCDDFISKPIKIQVLDSVLNKFFYSKQTCSEVKS